MAKQVGKIEKPAAERFKHGKKLYLVPLVYSGKDSPDDYKEKYRCYWQQVSEQLINLETKIGKVSQVYHESISESGEAGMKTLESLNPDSYQIARSKCDDGAVFETIEEQELLEEVMDWGRCILFGFVSKRVASKVAAFYTEASGKRYEFMAKRIGETLKDDEAGLLFITEGHRVQFPADIEIFSISPPVLDEIHRWLRDRVEEKQGKDND